MRWEKKPELHNLGIRQGHPLATGLVGYWPMWEGGGTRVMDVSGNGRDGVVGGPVGKVTPIGAAFDFDGSNDYVSIAKPFGLFTGASDWSIAAIATIETSATSQFIFAPRAERDWYLGADISSGSFAYRFGFSGGGSFKAITGYDYPVNETRLLVGTCKSLLLSIYVDGVLGSTYNAAGRTPGSLTGVTCFGIGWDLPATTFYKMNGQLHAVGIYSRSLNASEVADLYSDPWSLIRPRARSYFYAATAPSGSPVARIVGGKLIRGGLLTGKRLAA